MKDGKPGQAPKLMVGFSEEGPFAVRRIGPLVPGRDATEVITPPGTGEVALDAAEAHLEKAGYGPQRIHGEDGGSISGWTRRYGDGYDRIFGNLKGE